MDYAEFLGFSLDETLLENSCYKIQYIFVGTHCKRVSISKN